MTSEESTGYVPFVDQDAYPPKGQYNPVPPRPASRELIMFVTGHTHARIKLTLSLLQFYVIVDLMQRAMHRLLCISKHTAATRHRDIWPAS